MGGRNGTWKAKAEKNKRTIYCYLKRKNKIASEKHIKCFREATKKGGFLRHLQRVANTSNIIKKCLCRHTGQGKYVWKTYDSASVSLHFGIDFVMSGFACTESTKDCDLESTQNLYFCLP